MACLEGLPEESLFSKKQQHGSMIYVCKVASDQTMILLEQCILNRQRPKWRCGAIMHCATFGENLKSTSAPHSKNHTCWWRDDEIGLVATGPEHLTVIESTMNSSVYQSILESNVRTSVQQLKLSQYRVMQQDNDPKHIGKSMTERLEREEAMGCYSKSKSRAHPG